VIDARGKRDGGARLRHGALAVAPGVGVQMVKHCRWWFCDRVVLRVEKALYGLSIDGRLDGRSSLNDGKCQICRFKPELYTSPLLSSLLISCSQLPHRTAPHFRHSSHDL
jgi:hypothetical protein